MFNMGRAPARPQWSQSGFICMTLSTCRKLAANLSFEVHSIAFSNEFRDLYSNSGPHLQGRTSNLKYCCSPWEWANSASAPFPFGIMPYSSSPAMNPYYSQSSLQSPSTRYPSPKRYSLQLTRIQGEVGDTVHFGVGACLSNSPCDAPSRIHGKISKHSFRCIPSKTRIFRQLMSERGGDLSSMGRSY